MCSVCVRLGVDGVGVADSPVLVRGRWVKVLSPQQWSMVRRATEREVWRQRPSDPVWCSECMICGHVVAVECKSQRAASLALLRHCADAHSEVSSGVTTPAGGGGSPPKGAMRRSRKR